MTGVVLLAPCVAQRGIGAEASETDEPIQIGLVVIDTAAQAEESGVGTASPYHDTGLALIDAMNADGGFGGRQVEVIDAAVEFTNPNHDTEFQAVCEKLTVDNHVEAVVFDGIVYNDSFNSCLGDAGVPIFYSASTTGSNIGDGSDLETYPIVAVNSVNLDRRLTSIMNKAIEASFLPAGSKIGVVLEDCAYNVRAYENILQPIADENEITLERADVTCAHGYADNDSNLAYIQSLALKFKTEDVDSVMFLTMYENGVLYYFAQGAQSQNWAPQYLLFHPQGSAEAMEIYPPEQLVNMRGFGGIPLVDITNPPEPPEAQAAVREECLSRARSNGVAARTFAEQVTVFQVCDALRLLGQALEISGGLGGADALILAVEEIGSDFISTLTIDGVTNFGPGRHDGMELTAVSTFDETCNCFSYMLIPPGPIE